MPPRSADRSIAPHSKAPMAACILGVIVKSRSSQVRGGMVTIRPLEDVGSDGDSVGISPLHVKMTLCPSPSQAPTET
jgi:hypothetical protein